MSETDDSNRNNLIAEVTLLTMDLGSNDIEAQWDKIMAILSTRPTAVLQTIATAGSQLSKELLNLFTNH